jgi:hypothetical protein
VAQGSRSGEEFGVSFSEDPLQGRRGSDADPTQGGVGDDPTQGGKAKKDDRDPTQGREVGEDPSEDPTEGREVGEQPGEDPTERAP